MSVKDTRSTIYLPSSQSSNGASPISFDWPTLIGGQRTGTPNPGWKTRIARGEGTGSGMTASEVQIKNKKPFNYSYRSNADPLNTFGAASGYYNVPPQVNFDTSQQVDVTERARVKAYNLLASNFSGSQFIAEFHQALDMIRHPAISMRQRVSKMISQNQSRRRKMQFNTGGFREFSKAAADSWLEYSFGWQPLISDIKNGYEELQRLSNTTREVPFTATYHSTNQFPNTFFAGEQLFGPVGVNFFYKSSTEHSCQIKGSAVLKPEVSIPAFRLGVLPAQWIPVLWECAPWSFLIDYFGSVGDVLSSSVTASYYNFKYVSETYKSVCTYDITTQSVLHAPHLWHFDSQDEMLIQYDAKVISRSVTSAVPLPSLRVRSNLSSTKVLNIAALILGAAADASLKHKRLKES